MKKRSYVFLCLFLCIALAAAGFAFSVSADVRIQAAYTFDDPANLSAEVGGKYPLIQNIFSGSLSSVDGYRNGGARGYAELDPVLFSGQDSLSFGAWIRLSASEVQRQAEILEVIDQSGAGIELKISRGELILTLTAGGKTSSCSADFSASMATDSDWNHVAFTYSRFGDSGVLFLYINGVYKANSRQVVDLSKLEAKNAYLSNLTFDEVYITNTALPLDKIGKLMSSSLSGFYRTEENETSSSTDTGSSEPNPPITVNAYNYSWAAYLFEDLSVGKDSHNGDLNANADSVHCTKINSSNLKSKFGFAFIRRENQSAASYLSLDSRLFEGQEAFTFACWVYRSGQSRANQECLLDLNGSGQNTLRFAPYCVDAGGKASAYVEYTDATGRIQHKTIGNGSPANPQNTWVHYALTVSSSGTVTVYVNAVAAATFETGVKPASMGLSDAKVVTGSSASDGSRTAIDEVYVTPKVLSDVELRKLRYYGTAVYTAGPTQDPGVVPGEEDPIDDPNKPTYIDLTEDSYQQTGEIIGGFIGTTFDDRGNIGADWNNGANAAVTGGQLTNGIASYGFALDGNATFLRYPKGILDGANELTVSLSYKWDGPNAVLTRSQRLFDFSRKNSSVEDPTAFIFLEMGNGSSGLRLGLSDGITSTYLSCDYNQTDVWTRVTVTVADGTVTLYLNDQVAATGYTDVVVSAMNPNFCYIGRSGVKGDPHFRGTVDEIYVSASALPESRVGTFLDGISIAVNGKGEKTKDVWGTVILIIIAVAAVLVLSIIGIILFTVLRRDKKAGAEAVLPTVVSEPEPSESPVIESSDARSDQTDGPRSARHSRRKHENRGAEDHSTVRFQSLSDLPFLDAEPGAGQAPEAPAPQTVNDEEEDLFD